MIQALRSLGRRRVLSCVAVALVASAAAGFAVAHSGANGGTEATVDLSKARRLPSLTLEDLNAEPVELDDLVGLPLVLNFWSSTCVPCIEEMPDIESVSKSLGERVTFVGVNLRDEPEAARAMRDRTKVTYPLLRDPAGDLARALGVVNLPATVLALGDGTLIDVIHAQVSQERLCEQINQALLNRSLTECGNG